MASIAPNPEDNSCWVCLNGAGDKRSPLLRDCACHGSSGHAHLRCIIRNAISHTEAILHSTKTNEKPNDGSNQLGRNIWSECPLCKYPYEGETLQALACAIQQRYGKDHVTSDAGSECSTMRTVKGSSTQPLLKKESSKPLPKFIRKLTLQTIANAKAKSPKHTYKEEAIHLYQQVLEIERVEQESFADRRCTALERNVVAEEIWLMCCIGETYADLGQFQNAVSILEEALALAERGGCCDEAFEDCARAHRIISEVMLSNGDVDGAEKRIQIAKGIWESRESRNKQSTRRHSLEFLKYLWHFGVVMVKVGDRDTGLDALNSTLTRGERELGSNYSLVKTWKQTIGKYS